MQTEAHLPLLPLRVLELCPRLPPSLLGLPRIRARASRQGTPSKAKKTSDDSDEGTEGTADHEEPLSPLAARGQRGQRRSYVEPDSEDEDESSGRKRVKMESLDDDDGSVFDAFTNAAGHVEEDFEV